MSIIMAIMLLIVAPIIFYLISTMLTTSLTAGGEIKLMFYILLILALVQPLIVPVIERTQISNYRKNLKTKMAPEQLYLTVSIIKFTFVESIYIYGLLTYLVSNQQNLIYYFYVIGVIWTLIYWPRKTKFEEFITKVLINE